MENNLIPLQHLCTHYHAEISFVHSLHDYGLIEITTIEQQTYIAEEQIKEIERMIHLHYDLDINIEGIDAINHLMQRVNDLNKELIGLRNRLNRYE
ncbi:MAG TPA: chaperone modulator CbpM [Arachidicoccus sp.]